MESVLAEKIAESKESILKRLSIFEGKRLQGQRVLRGDNVDEPLRDYAKKLIQSWRSFQTKADFDLDDEVMYVLPRLPAKDVAVLRGYYVENLTQREIARTMGVTQGNISHRLSATMIRVSFLLKHAYVSEEEVRDLIAKVLGKSKDHPKTDCIFHLYCTYYRNQSFTALRSGVGQPCVCVWNTQFIKNFKRTHEGTPAARAFFRDYVKHASIITSCDSPYTWDKKLLDEGLPEEYPKTDTENNYIKSAKLRNNSILSKERGEAGHLTESMLTGLVCDFEKQGRIVTEREAASIMGYRTRGSLIKAFKKYDLSRLRRYVLSLDPDAVGDAETVKQFNKFIENGLSVSEQANAFWKAKIKRNKRVFQFMLGEEIGGFLYNKHSPFRSAVRNSMVIEFWFWVERYMDDPDPVARTTEKLGLSPKDLFYLVRSEYVPDKYRDMLKEVSSMVNLSWAKLGTNSFLHRPPKLPSEGIATRPGGGSVFSEIRISRVIAEHIHKEMWLEHSSSILGMSPEYLLSRIQGSKYLTGLCGKLRKEEEELRIEAMANSVKRYAQNKGAVKVLAEKWGMSERGVRELLSGKVLKYKKLSEVYKSVRKSQANLPSNARLLKEIKKIKSKDGWVQELSAKYGVRTQRLYERYLDKSFSKEVKKILTNSHG